MKVQKVIGWRALEAFLSQLKDFPYQEMFADEDMSIGRTVHWCNLFNARSDVVFSIEMCDKKGNRKRPIYETSVKNPEIVSVETAPLSREKHTVDSMRAFREALTQGKIHVGHCGIHVFIPEMEEEFETYRDKENLVFEVQYRPKQ